MKKNSVILCLYSIIVIVYSLIVKTFNFSNINKINTIFWIVSLLLFIILFRIRKNNNYLNKNTLRLVIISLLSYFIIIYALGVIIGFSRNIFNTSLKGILYNIFPVFVMIISQEMIRYFYSLNTILNRKPLYYLTISYVLYYCIFQFDISKITIIEYDFIFLCTILFVIVAKECLYTYLAKNVGISSNVLMRLVMELYIFIVPIIPSFGNYITSVIGIGYPVYVYFLVNKGISYYNKEKSYIGRASFNFVLIPIILILFVIVSLTSGLFKYQLVAIMSNSMYPVFNRGDAILYEKTKNYDEIVEGQVIAYVKENVLVTHRVTKKEEIGGKYYFYTKGDNNAAIDAYQISEDEVKGIVLYRLPYIGFPTVWFNEAID